ncbi:hypothetical protein DSECCO2_253140 [anaerobic digester metagenome]
MKGIKKAQNKILKEFNNIKGLEEIIEKVINLLSSDRYALVYDVSGLMEGGLRDESLDDLLSLSQVGYAANVLRDPPLYVASLTGVIISSHFIAMVSMVDFISYAYKQENLTHEDLKKNHTILERLMCCLDGFDTVGSYDVPDESFYLKLRGVKWDKRAKKLFKRLSTLKFEVSFEKFGSGTTSFGTGEDFALTFLAACNCVNHERDRINPEDVVIAYKTYLKLIDTDISSL